MKKILKILSVFALASPISTAVSCSKAKDEDKTITLNCKGTEYGDFNISFKQQQIQTIEYSDAKNGDKSIGGFNLDILFKKKTNNDSYEYMRYKGNRYYYYLSEIKFSWINENKENSDEYIKKADELYSIFEFEFESKSKTVEIDTKKLDPIKVYISSLKA